MEGIMNLDHNSCKPPTVRGQMVVKQGNLPDSGVINVTGGQAIIGEPLTLLSSSTVNIEQGAKLSIKDDFIVDGANIVLANSATLDVDPSWKLNGTLTLDGEPVLLPTPVVEGFGLIIETDGRAQGNGRFVVKVENRGVLAPGQSAGVLLFNENYTQSIGGVMEMEIGGVAPISEHDQINVAGDADLDGELSISLIDGFEPDFFDNVTVVTYDSRSGQFSNVTGAFVSELMTLAPIYGANALTLFAALPAGSNLDGVVNFDDFVVLTNNCEAGTTSWRKGDFDLNNVTNFDDFVILTNTFETMVPNPVSLIPEPMGLSVLVLGVIIRLPRKRARTHSRA